MSHLEDELELQLKCWGVSYQREYRAILSRRFKWDFYIEQDDWMIGLPSSPVLIEVQGGIWVKGGHSTGTGITRDAEKNNLAVLAGYRTLIVTSEHIKSGQALKWIQEAVQK